MKEKKEKKYITIKVFRSTRDNLRLASALTGKQMVEVAEEALSNYLKKELPPGGIF